MLESKVFLKNKKHISNTSIFKNEIYESFFYFLIEKNKNYKTKSFFSTIFRYLHDSFFLDEETDKPRDYIQFLIGENIFNYDSNKIQSPSTTKEHILFRYFDELFDQYLLEQE